MKRTMLCILISLCLLTGCAPKKDAAPPSVEQQISAAMELCGNNASKGMAQLQKLDATLLDGAVTESGEYTLAVYQLQRGDRWLLLWRLECAQQEEYPGTLDTLRLSWQGADYYLSDGDSVYSTVQGRNGNSVAFNIQDGDMTGGTSSFGVVYLQSAASAYEAHLTHTLQGKKTIITTTNENLTSVTEEAEYTVELRAAVAEE